MKPKAKSWHKDRIAELTLRKEDVRLSATLLAAFLIGAYSLAYPVYYQVKDVWPFVAWVLIAVVIFISLTIGKQIIKVAKRNDILNEQLKHNFDVVLGREEKETIR